MGNRILTLPNSSVENNKNWQYNCMYFSKFIVLVYYNALYQEEKIKCKLSNFFNFIVCLRVMLIILNFFFDMRPIAYLTDCMTDPPPLKKSNSLHQDF